VYQGSGYAPDVTWSGDATLAYGGLYQIKLQAMLLDNGFVVIAPFADGIAWETNFPGYSVSSDSRFIPELLNAIGEGTFGTVDTTRLYATGISSGGYMTSRMAVSYAGSFRALAIQSGSYATCSNVACIIPSMLPVDHPPTLFLHGRNDLIVPLATARAYKDRLDAQGFETSLIVDPDVGHEWLEVAPEEITCWFLTH
jgi:poly(3-hydroxybutyrate) depolymerase